MKQVTGELANGLRIITNEMPDSQSVTVCIFVRAGSRNEVFEVNGGVSHFLEHLLFKGAKKRPTTKDIAEAIDGVGGLQNAYTANDLTNYYVKVPKQHLRLAVDVLSDMIKDPLLDPEEIDRERGVVIEEMNVYRDDPARFVQELLPRLLWPNDPLGQEIIGTEEVINRITRDEIATYQKLYYSPNNMVVSVAGNTTHEEVMRLVEEFMGEMESKDLPPLPVLKGGLSKTVARRLDKDTNQAHLNIGTVAFPYRDPRDAAAKVLTSLLGGGMSSRLFMNVRERKGLAYTVYADYHSFVDTGQFDIYAGVNLDKVPNAIEAIMDELKNVQEELVSEEELERTKNKVIGTLQLSLENTYGVADRQGTQMLLLNDSEIAEDTIKRVQKVTAEEVQAVAKELLSSSGLRFAVIAPDGTVASEIFEKLVKE